jgi:hypothetical protein
VVETTTNLNVATNWQAIHTNTVPFWHINFPAPSNWRRFYRVLTDN